MNDEQVVEHEDEDPDEDSTSTSPRASRRASKRKGVPSTFVPRPTPAPQGAPRVRKLTLRNRSGLLLFLPVLNDDGTKKSLRMGANATVQVPEDQLTDHARRLLRQGMISIDPHR